MATKGPEGKYQRKRDVLTVQGRGDVASRTVSSERTRLGRREPVRDIVTRVRDLVLTTNGDAASRADAYVKAAAGLRQFAYEERERTSKPDGGLLLTSMLLSSTGTLVLEQHPKLGMAEIAGGIVILTALGVREGNATLRKRKYKKEARRFEDEAARLDRRQRDALYVADTKRLQQLRDRRFLYGGGVGAAVALAMAEAVAIQKHATYGAKVGLAVILAVDIALVGGLAIKDSLEIRRLKKHQAKLLSYHPASS